MCKKKLNDSNKWFLCSKTLQSHSHSHLPQNIGIVILQLSSWKKKARRDSAKIEFQRGKYQQQTKK